jgi:hypothetical protein
LSRQQRQPPGPPPGPPSLRVSLSYRVSRKQSRRGSERDTERSSERDRGARAPRVRGVHLADTPSGGGRGASLRSPNARLGPRADRPGPGPGATTRLPQQRPSPPLRPRQHPFLPTAGAAAAGSGPSAGSPVPSPSRREQQPPEHRSSGSSESSRACFAAADARSPGPTRGPALFTGGASRPQPRPLRPPPPHPRDTESAWLPPIATPPRLGRFGVTPPPARRAGGISGSGSLVGRRQRGRGNEGTEGARERWRSKSEKEVGRGRERERLGEREGERERERDSERERVGPQQVQSGQLTVIRRLFDGYSSVPVHTCMARTLSCSRVCSSMRVLARACACLRVCACSSARRERETEAVGGQRRDEWTRRGGGIWPHSATHQARQR